MATFYQRNSAPDCNEKNKLFTAQNQKLQDIFDRHLKVRGKGSGDYLPVIKELIRYMSENFHEENVIMMHAHYPQFLEHARAHQKFTQKVEEFLKGYEEGDNDLGFKIFIFLKDWIRDHTLKLDVECSEYLRKNKRNIETASEEDASFARPVFA